jgi:hypothetical protein
MRGRPGGRLRFTALKGVSDETMARPGLLGNRKFWDLVRYIDALCPGAPFAAETLAVGVLEKMWLIVGEDGNTEFRSSRQVEATVAWKGKPGVLCAAIVLAGFLDKQPGGRLNVHHFWHHAPDFVKRRRTRSRERDARGEAKTAEISDESAENLRNSCESPADAANGRSRNKKSRKKRDRTPVVSDGQ